MSRGPSGVKSWSPKPSPLLTPPAPIRDARKGPGTKEPESATRRLARFAARKAIPIGPAAAPRSIMAPNGLIPHHGADFTEEPAVTHPKSAASALSPSLRL